MDRLDKTIESVQNVIDSFEGHADVNNIIMYSEMEAKPVLATLEAIKDSLREIQKMQNYTNASILSSKVEIPKKEIPKKEMINHPIHYQGLEVNGQSVECIEAMDQLKGWFKTATFCELNSFKYNWRVGEKDIVPQELGKIAWYGDKAKKLWEENLKWYYPKNKHHYAIVGGTKMKNPTTGEWVEALLYTDGKGFYVRESNDFTNKFKLEK